MRILAVAFAMSSVIGISILSLETAVYQGRIGDGDTIECGDVRSDVREARTLLDEPPTLIPTLDIRLRVMAKHLRICHPESPEAAEVAGDAYLRVSREFTLNSWFCRRWWAFQAHRSYVAALRRAPDRQPLWAKNGEVWNDIGWLARAKTSYLRAIELNPDDDNVVTTLGVILRTLDEPEIAETVFRNYLASDSPTRDPFVVADVNLALGRILAKKGRNDEAIDFMKNSTGHAEELLNSRLSRSYSGCAFQALGQLYGKVGRFDDETENRIKAAELDHYWDFAQEDAAIRAYRRGHFERALPFAERAVELETSSTNVALKALVLLALDRDEDALALLNEEPLKVGVVARWLGLDAAVARDVVAGHYALAEKKFDDAERRFARALRPVTIPHVAFLVTPYNDYNRSRAFVHEMALLGLAWTYSAQARHAEALPFLDTLVRQVPNNFFARMARVTSLTGLRRYNEAEVALAKLAKLYPDNPYVVNQLGILALNRGRFDDAGDAFKRAANVAPGAFPCPYEGLGLSYLRQGRTKEAESMLAKAIDVAPDRDARKYSALAKIRIREHRYDEARDLLEKALENVPSHPESRKLLDALNAAHPDS
ncbi:MAG: tetratricopeptide repeat protein [Deltaproteobacteria bacterium]|nr:tetratricopeptide repeat protein [Deltaproteobacteria bacterium]